MIPLRLFSFKPVTILSTKLSPSFWWFHKSFNALTKSQHALKKTFASRRSALFCITNFLLGSLQSYWPPQAAHHQLYCFFFLCAPMTPTKFYPPAEHNYSARRHMMDVTPRTPDASALILLKKAKLLRKMYCAMLRRPMSSPITCISSIACPTDQMSITAHVATLLDLLLYFLEKRFELLCTLHAFLLLFLGICQDCFGPCTF